MPSWIKLRVPAFGQPANTVLRVDSPGQAAQLLNGGFADAATDPGGAPPAVPAGSPGGDFTTDAELAAALAGLGAGAAAPTTDAAREAYVPTRLSDANLRAASGPPLNTAVILGDSITAKFGPTGGAYGADSYWLWAQRFLGQRMQLLNNAGVVGQTSAQILARFDTDVTPYRPGYVIVLAGRNDGTIGAAATQANLAAIYDKCAALGATVVACTLPPGNGLSAGQRAADNKTNQWIKRQAQVRRNFLVCDWTAVLQDASGNFDYPTVTPDGIHPSPVGAQRMGRVLAAVLAPRVPAVDRLVSNNDDADNLTTNPLLFGSVDDVDGGGTGLVATGWRAGLIGSGGAYSAAKVACADAPGLFWQQLTVTGTGTGGAQVVQWADANVARVQAGKLYVARCEVESDGWTRSAANGSYGYGLSLGVQCFDSGWSGLGSAFDCRAVDPSDHEVPGERMVLETPPLLIPTDTVHLAVSVNLCAVGTVRVRRAGLRPVLTSTDS